MKKYEILFTEKFVIVLRFFYIKNGLNILNNFDIISYSLSHWNSELFCNTLSQNIASFFETFVNKKF